MGATLVEESELALLHLHSAQAEPLFALLEQERATLTPWLPWLQSIHSVTDLQHFIRSALLQLAQGRALQCALRYQGRLVGMCGFQSFNQSQKQAELGYWLATSWRGRGIVTRACRLLLAHGFDVLGMERIVIATAGDNYPSQALCERLGFQPVWGGPPRGQFADCVVEHIIYALSREQWLRSL